jgi:hypothetical protein
MKWLSALIERHAVSAHTTYGPVRSDTLSLRSDVTPSKPRAINVECLAVPGRTTHGPGRAHEMSFQKALSPRKNALSRTDDMLSFKKRLLALQGAKSCSFEATQPLTKQRTVPDERPAVTGRTTCDPLSNDTLSFRIDSCAEGEAHFP